MLVEWLSTLGPLHWLILFLVLIAIEMAVGTVDLLWVSLAALATAAFAFVDPNEWGQWQGQLLVFGAASAVLILLGRTVFSGMRAVVAEHPTLNKRMAHLIGQRGTVTETFQAGVGQVRIGDTVWRARTAEGDNPFPGAVVVVEAAESATVVVRQT